MFGDVAHASSGEGGERLLSQRIAEAFGFHACGITADCQNRDELTGNGKHLSSWSGPDAFWPSPCKIT